MIDTRKQAITGLIPPQLGESLIREAWPSVAAFPVAASLGRKLICSMIGAPLGWVLLLPLYFLKILPFVAKRYTLTNRRLMIDRGLKPSPSHEVALSAIDDVRISRDANSAFYRCGTLEILSKGRVVLTLPAVPEPESLRHGILDAARAWAPASVTPRAPSAPAMNSPTADAANLPTA